MRKIFKKTDSLDKRACTKFFLSEELLMENAARGLADFIRSKAVEAKSALFLVGGGNNGADGYAAARMLSGNLDVKIFCVYPPKSPLAKLQSKRAKAAGVKLVKSLKTNADIYVDCILGSGQKGVIDQNLSTVISTINAKNGVKIACDIPTGIYSQSAFKADVTLTMGALKSVLFEDFAKDFVGEIKVCDLGLDESLFAPKSDLFLLEKSDLVLPKRERQNSNKGDFGHLVIVSGEHKGAAILSGLSALSFGAGLVSLLSTDNIDEINKNPSLMQTRSLPAKTTAIIAGPGLGNTRIDTAWFEKLPFVIDADLCYDDRIPAITAKNSNCVLTPHPKEFASLLKIFGLGEKGTDEIQAERFELARKFSLLFKGVLVLKGANTIVARNGVLYVCAFGSQALSKGGSGDVLAGLIGALLAQGYTPLGAATNAVLAHALAAANFQANNYALTPEGLIEGVKWL